jgi:NADPH:quinone reductase-like Zn-dependent oxidoreductase
MKAVIIRNFGGRDVLEFANIEKPNVCEGEVLIRIKAAGVNPVDTKVREGLLKSRMPNNLPITLGWDLAGVVVDTGHSARRFVPGDEVYAYARRMVIQYGTYAEYITLPESYITYKPHNISFEEAASVPLAALTAYQSIYDKGKLSKNQNILIIGASGGVGSFAVQFAKLKGAHVYAVAGANREEYLKKLGAEFVFDYSQGNWTKAFKELLPNGADLVFDCIGKDATLKGYGCTKSHGTLVSLITQPNEEMMNKYSVNHKYHFVEPNVLQLDKIRDWIEKGKVILHVDKVYNLADAAKAHEQIETGHTLGKIVLKVS